MARDKTTAVTAFALSLGARVTLYEGGIFATLSGQIPDFDPEHEVFVTSRAVVNGAAHNGGIVRTNGGTARSAMLGGNHVEQYTLQGIIAKFEPQRVDELLAAVLAAYAPEVAVAA